MKYLQDVYIVSWNPAGPKSDNPNKQLLLARYVAFVVIDLISEFISFLFFL